MANIFDIYELYKQYYGVAKYHVLPSADDKAISQKIAYSLEKRETESGAIQYSSKQISFNKTGLIGQDIWHPVQLWKSGTEFIDIDICTIRINGQKTIVKTAVSERKGTVKEQFAIDDYKFTIKGFLVGKNQTIPEKEISLLKDFYESSDPILLYGGYPELFLDESCRVVIDNLEFPDVQGKAYWIRPFNFTCESDFITDIIIQ
ncbi:DUF6046 domain-containing protein [Flavobacterium sp. '19STA2R22 D10 B1']|uniref:DUF6046 domain-containing protein n=1 Tax=Flavobacterium aerium TaxID=3037261 RepID=UPI00278C09C4|nr:DUF6046 domain-containing protein [Flavobacterium sp. '19STA2R22 D10 B1']